MFFFEALDNTEWWNEITEEVQVPESVPRENDLEHTM